MSPSTGSGLKARSRIVWASRDTDESIYGGGSHGGDLWSTRPFFENGDWWDPNGIRCDGVAALDFDDCALTKRLFGFLEPGTCRRVEIAVSPKPGLLRRMRALWRAGASCDWGCKGVCVEMRKCLEDLADDLGLSAEASSEGGKGMP